ncbi:MAG: hypothetical protein ACREJB_18400, partial [Planctomycetaceae bacterium]
MQSLKRLAEWYLGVPPVAPGEGTTWQVGYGSPWPAWLPVLAAVFLPLAVMGLCLWQFVRDADRRPLSTRLIVLGLESAAVIVLTVGLLVLSNAAVIALGLGLGIYAIVRGVIDAAPLWPRLGALAGRLAGVVLLTALLLLIEPPLIRIMGLAILVFVYVLYRLDAGRVPMPVRLLMTGLRLAAIAVLFVFLSQLTLSIDRTGLPVVVVLIDDSASMKLEDQYPDEDVNSAAERLIADGRFTDPSRLNLAKTILLRDEGAFLKSLLNRHKLRVYRFAESTSPLGERTEYLRPEEIDELLPHVARLRPEGEQTRPGPAVRKVLGDLRGTPPAAIVVLSDG